MQHSTTGFPNENTLCSVRGRNWTLRRVVLQVALLLVLPSQPLPSPRPLSTAALLGEVPLIYFKQFYKYLVMRPWGA